MRILLILLLLAPVAARAADDPAPELDAFLSAYAEATGFMGTALVARGDDVILARGYGMADLEHGVPHEPDTVLRLGSLTKQFTAAAVLRLQEQGLLDVRDTLATYLPDHPHGDRITLHQLLSHTAGVPNYTNLPAYGDVARDPHATAELIALFRDLPLDFEPGARFSYSNSGYVLLTAVIEAVTGRPYGEYLRDAFFEPLGMTRTAYDDAGEVVPGRAAGYVRDGGGYRVADFVDMSVPSGAGALRGTAGDLLTWTRALMGGEVLAPESLQAMTAPAAAIDPVSAYGYGLILNEGEHPSISHGGGIQGFSSALAWYPEDELVVVVLSNVQTAPSSAIAAGLAALVRGEPVEAPAVRAGVAVDPAVLRSYVGAYEIGPGAVIEVTTEEGALFVEVPGQGRYALVAASDARFHLAEMGAELRFVREEGAVVRVVVTQGGQEMPAEKVR